MYQVLNVSNNANLLEICMAFQMMCKKYPQYIFNFTKAFDILSNKYKRIVHDTLIYKISLNRLINLPYYDELFEVDEFLLIPFIEWLTDFKDFFYDTKYEINNKEYDKKIEIWYDSIESILVNLKDFINSFYLA